MLLVIDIGNTNTVLGVFEGESLVAHWRLTTQRDRTVDEYGVQCRTLFSLAGIDIAKITGIAIASVVPPLNGTLRDMAMQYLHIDPLFIDPMMDLGMPILYNPPHDVGADRIVNAIAAFEKFGGPTIVADFGTATTFDAISKAGEYLGGVIAPGIMISAEALFLRTAKLPRVEIKAPGRVIGATTVESMQSGLYFGYLGLVEGILARMKAELGEATVVGTGGLAPLIRQGCPQIQFVEETLILDGLRLVFARFHTIT
ncbi:MAG: type III pantothenate kinase [Acidobacteria bacterium]|nr:type III pantothenate kinase [Acidobacteriota bacterium]MBI3656436.1 type III pantothenate kinase [Acidobacteriota bacterium]